MSNWIRYGVAICGVVVLLPRGAIPALAQPAEHELIKALHLSNYPASMGPPDFSEKDTRGRPVSLTHLRGRVVLITFWASWCLECRPEMPQFEQLHRDFSEQGLSVIGINVREANPTIASYANELAITFPLVPDIEGKIYAAFGVIGLPTTFLIRRNGSAAALAIGARDWGKAPARELIKLLLAQPAMPGANR